MLLLSKQGFIFIIRGRLASVSNVDFKMYNYSWNMNTLIADTCSLVQEHLNTCQISIYLHSALVFMTNYDLLALDVKVIVQAKGGGMWENGISLIIIALGKYRTPVEVSIGIEYLR